MTANATTKRVMRRVPSAPGRRPAVTVVVPAYNYVRYLRECALSVLSQRDVEVRLIIVDDCSTDETPRVTAELAADARVTVLRNEPNRGHIPSVNRGMELVDTEFAVKLDADDLLPPGALARATALLEAHPRATFVYGRPRHFSARAPRAIDLPALSWTLWTGRDWIARLCRMGVNAISQPEVVMRTSILRRALPVQVALPHTSDMHLWLQLAAMGDVGRVNGPAQGYYREHDASMSRTVNAGVEFDLASRREAFDAFFDGVGGELTGADALREEALRTLAGHGLDLACRAYERGWAHDGQAQKFIDFALDAWPEAQDLPEWAMLERRQSAGIAGAARDPRFLFTSVTRRGLQEASRVRWRNTGEVGPQRWQQLVAR